MSVLLIDTSIASALGADSWVHAEILAALDRSSHSIHAACVPTTSTGRTSTFDALEAIEGLKILAVHPGPERPSRLLPWPMVRALGATFEACWSMLRIAAYIRRHDIRIIHSSDRPRDALASVLLSRITRAHSIVHVHVKYGTWMSRLRRWAIAEADARIAVSEFVKASLTTSGLPADTTHVVLNAVDLARWTPGAGRAAAREELSIAADAPVIVTVCRLFREKGPVELVRALDALRQRFPNVRLIVVGHDPDPSQAFFHELEDVVRDLGLGEHVVFTGRRDDVPALMAAADVFAMPSYEEPFGLVFGEAMAMGLPVVGLNNGGTPEVVGHGRHGLLSDPGDVESLADNLSALLGDPELRRRFGAAGRSRIESQFTTARMAADTARVYRLVAS